MNKAFEKILDRLQERRKLHSDLSVSDKLSVEEQEVQSRLCGCFSKAKQIVQEVEAEYNNGWIPCSEKLPDVETEVLIVAIRKYKDGSVKNIITTAIYEDGTVRENDSCWVWENIEGEWDEEEDCYIIPEGWWEDKKYNADCELNHAVDDEVVAWQPLPEQYKDS